MSSTSISVDHVGRQELEDMSRYQQPYVTFGLFRDNLLVKNFGPYVPPLRTFLYVLMHSLVYCYGKCFHTSACVSVCTSVCVYVSTGVLCISVEIHVSHCTDICIPLHRFVQISLSILYLCMYYV